MTIVDLIIRTIDSVSRPLDRPDNHGPLLNVLAWFLAVCNVIIVLTRLASKTFYSKNLGLDDTLICASLTLSIGQVIAFSIAVTNGVGRHIKTVTGQDILSFQKALYAANILWHCGQVFSKLSVTTFLRAISPTQFNMKATTVVYGITFVWGVTALFILAFRCNAPHTWKVIGNTCLDVHYVWTYINTMNVLIDLLLTALPFAALWSVKLPTKKKVLVSCFFGARIFAVGAIMFQMVEISGLKESNDPTDDATFDMWRVHIAMSLAQTIDIVTACVPFLKPFVDGLESGMIRNDNLRRRTTFKATRRGKYWGTMGQNTTKRRPGKFLQSIWRSQRVEQTIIRAERRGSWSGSSILAMNHERHVHAMRPIHSHGTSNSDITNNTTFAEDRISQETEWGGIQSESSLGNINRQ